MKILDTPMSGLVLIEPEVFGDARGFFLETYRDEGLRRTGVAQPFVQDGHSRSSRGVLRGVHYQIQRPQGKLVYVVRGAIFDVAVDVRAGSPTFGKWYGAVLSDANHHQIYLAPGYAHAFQVLSDVADVIYKCTDYYDPEDQGGIPWDDPDVGVEWPLADPLLSDRDRRHETLKQHAPNILPRLTVDP